MSTAPMERNTVINVPASALGYVPTNDEDPEAMKHVSFPFVIDCRIGDKVVIFEPEDVDTRNALEAVGLTVTFIHPEWAQRFPLAAIAYALASVSG